MSGSIFPALGSVLVLTLYCASLHRCTAGVADGGSGGRIYIVRRAADPAYTAGPPSAHGLQDSFHETGARYYGCDSVLQQRVVKVTQLQAQRNQERHILTTLPRVDFGRMLCSALLNNEELCSFNLSKNWSRSLRVAHDSCVTSPLAVVSFTKKRGAAKRPQ